MKTDFLQFIYRAINDLLTQNLGFFDAMGRNLFRMFSTILIAWYGVKSALAAVSGRHGFRFDEFASLLLSISFGFAMVNYYSAPIPGIGASFHNLVTDEAQFLANRINQAELQTVVDRISDFEARIDAPGVTDFPGMGIYLVVIVLLAAAQAVSIVVIAYGFIASAVCVLVGPVFVPFFIVPRLDWLFWGWLRCFLQYAFYEVVAAAVVYIIGNLVIGVVTLEGTGTISTVQLIGWFPVLGITLGSAIFVLLKVPSLTSQIFSGASGDGSAGILERMFAQER